MFCYHCGTVVGAAANYCTKCGKELVKNVSETPSHADIESDVSKPGPSQSSKAGGAFGRVFSFKEYYEHKTKTDQGRQVTSKKQKKVKGCKGKEQNPEVVIFIGLMQWSEEELNLKPRRGKRLALKVPRDATYKVLCEKAVVKWKAYHSNLYEEDEEYVLLLDNCKDALFLPGSAREFFSLQRYQEEVGKDFKQITLYLCTAKEFYRSETVDLDWSDASDKEGNNSANRPENSAPAKRLKEDPHFSCDKEFNKPSVCEETDIQIQHDEEVAMELQRQFLDERDCQNQVVTPTADPNVESEASEKSSYPDKEDETGFSGRENFTTPSAVVQALEKRVDKENQFFITVRRKTPLQRIKLVAYEAKKQGAHHQMRVKFLGETGIDSGALTREFFTEVVPAIGNTLFSSGSPIDSTYHVQNGNFRTSGEIVASSLAQGGPPPCFLDEKAFQTMVKNEIDILNLNAENDLTLSESQLIDSIKSDIDNHRDAILEHGYTGVIDMEHIDDIARSVTVSLVNKRILYLNEFKEGLTLYGLSDIVTNQPNVCQPLFVRGQVQNVDATHLFSLMSPEYSPAGSSRQELEETLMDNFQDFLMALDDGNITGYDTAVAWNYNENDPEPDIPEAIVEPFIEKFETADLTSAGILGWLTGQKHRQLNGETSKSQ